MSPSYSRQKRGLVRRDFRIRKTGTVSAGREAHNVTPSNAHVDIRRYRCVWNVDRWRVRALWIFTGGENPSMAPCTCFVAIRRRESDVYVYAYARIHDQTPAR